MCDVAVSLSVAFGLPFGAVPFDTVCLPSRYLENVPAIVPLLEKEYRNAAARLESTQDELNDLHPDK